MKVGIMSDTHDNIPNIERAVNVMNDVNVDVVIHLGDHVSPFSLDIFGDIDAERHAIFGNNDGDIATLKRIADKKGINLHRTPYEIELDGRRAILLHGYGSKDLTLRMVEALASCGHYDLVLFGHIHECVDKRIGNCRIINPGEVFSMLSGKSTVAILDTATMDVEYIELL